MATISRRPSTRPRFRPTARTDGPPHGLWERRETTTGTLHKGRPCTSQAAALHRRPISQRAIRDLCRISRCTACGHDVEEESQRRDQGGKWTRTARSGRGRTQHTRVRNLSGGQRAVVRKGSAASRHRRRLRVIALTGIILAELGFRREAVQPASEPVFVIWSSMWV